MTNEIKQPSERARERVRLAREFGLGVDDEQARRIGLMLDEEYDAGYDAGYRSVAWAPGWGQ